MEFWNKIVSAGWNLRQLKELLKESIGTMTIVINMQIKLIIFKMCLNRHFYVLPEIWLNIVRMTNHMTYFNPCQIFGKEISFRIPLTANNDNNPESPYCTILSEK